MKNLITSAIVLTLAAAVQANDTEIFTGGGGGGNTNISFILDTSRSMTAWATDENDSDNPARPAYDPSEVYPTDKYGFDANSYYVFKKPTGGRRGGDRIDLEDLSNTEIEQIKAREFNISALNCSLRNSIIDSLDNIGESTGDYAFFEPGQGWGNGETSTNSGTILQCNEGGGSYNYFGVNYDYVVNDTGYQEFNTPYTNQDRITVCTRYFFGYCIRTSSINVTYNWADDSYDTIWSGNYLNYWGAPLLDGEVSERLTRMELVQKAAKEVISSTSLTNVNFSLMRFSRDSDGGFVSIPMTPLNEISDEFSTAVDSFDAIGGTPIEETLYEAYLYLSGGNVDYGLDSVVATWNQPENKEDWLRNSDYFSEDNISEDYISSPSVATSRNGNTYIAPDFSGCQPNTKVILFSDGEPSSDNASDKIESLLTEKNIIFPTPRPSYLNSNCGNNGRNPSSTGTCAEELAYTMANGDHRTDIVGNQTIIVDTMGGFVTSDDDATQKLQDIAEAGGGTFYPVDDYQSMVDNFRDAIVDVIKSPSSFTSPAIAVSSYNSLEQSDELYYAVFKPTDNAAWKGNLKRYKISNDGIVDIRNAFAIDPSTGFFRDSAVSYWSDEVDGANVELGGAASRLGDTPRKILGILDGQLQQLSTTSLVNLSDDTLGLNLLEGITLDLNLTDNLSYKSSLINWLMGLNDDGSPRLEMEDPIHNRPIVLNYSNNKQVVFVGTNGGYLHAFDTDSGQEVYSIITEELLQNSNYYRVPGMASATEKVFGIDGPISFWHDDLNLDGVINNGEKAYLYVAMRRGGHTYYAYDVSNRAEPQLLWQKNGPYSDTIAKNVPSVSSGFERLGQTWSALQPVRIAWGEDSSKVVLLAGGGYDPVQDGSSATRLNDPQTIGNTVYMIDPIDGTVLWDSFSSLTNLQGDMSSSFASDIAPVDKDSDGNVDIIYAADVGGRVWRFDLNGNDTASYTGGMIADLNTSATEGAAGNRRFFVKPDVAYFSSIDDSQVIINIGSGYRPHPLNTDVQDKMYILRDVNGLVKSSTTPYITITEDNLEDIKLGELNDYGWYASLYSSGEKIMANALTLGGVITFNSFAPSSSASAGSCSGNLGQSRTYRFNLPDIVKKEPKKYCDVYPEECDDNVCITNPDSLGCLCKLNPYLPECEILDPPYCERIPTPSDCLSCDDDPTLCEDTYKPDPKAVIVPCDDPNGCNCEDRAVKILSGTSMTDSSLSVCDMFEASSWKEEI